MILNENFVEFIDLLNERQVKYVLVDGLAVIFQGYGRTTGDIDFFVEISEENASKILDAIRSFWGTAVGFTKEDFLKPDNVMMMGRPPFRIDILTGISGVTFDEAYTSSHIYSEERFTVRTIHINELIRNKKSSGRLKDLADADMLEKILKKRNKQT